METEFAFRHHNSDPEKAAAVYESMKVSEQVRSSTGGFHMEDVAEPPCSLPLQCLKAEDIASAVTFVLSAPPHVQVCESFRLPASLGVKVQ